MKVRIDTDKNFIEGQGHLVKGQGQIGEFGKNVFGLMDVQTVGPIVPKLGMGLDGHLASSI